MSYTMDWDSQTPPAMPSDWNAASEFATIVASSVGVTPISSPNVLGCTSDGGKYAATYQTADTTGGDVSIIGNIYFAGASVPLMDYQSVALLARGNSNSLAYASSTMYELRISRGSPSSLILNAIVGGAVTQLASLAVSWPHTVWLSPTFTLNGTALSAALQNVSTGQWLNSSGSFQAGQTTAISLNDNTISGSGFYGYGYQTNSGNAYADNFTVTGLLPYGLPGWSGIYKPVTYQDPLKRYRMR